ncbi:MAG TPA: hypothetical protein VH331_01495 [Allosphingosinicella sp.]|jgi:hypothetical protein|nr:hypothetical protein [Allosphingosinicella sp.]
MRPIVHIGYHKTATTWFQRSVNPHALSHRWIPRVRVQEALLDPSGMAFDAEKARALLIDGDGGRPPLLCEENLSGYIHNGGLHGFLPPAVAERIHAVLPDAQIVIFVRSQVSMIAACYRQYVRGGGTHAVHRYLFPTLYLRGAYAQPFKVPRFSFDHFEYDRLIALYDALFGRENVHVYPFEDLSDPAAMLARMETDLELRLDRDRVRFDRPNASWTDALLPVARVLNHFTARTVEDKEHVAHIPGFYVARSALLSALGRVLPRRKGSPLLGTRLERWIEGRFAASNARLRELRPGLLPEDLYPSGESELEAPPAADTPERPPGLTLVGLRWSLYAIALLLMIAGAVALVRLTFG